MKLAHTITRVSVGRKFLTVGQVGEAWQSSKEIQFDTVRQIFLSNATKPQPFTHGFLNL